MLVSGTAAAVTQDHNLDAGQNPILMTDCTLLANDITVTLSANVTGGLSCDQDDSVVAVSVCHTKGLKSSRSSVVTQTNGVVTCTVTTAEACINTVSGSSYPTVSTVDGTVAQEYPESACSQANALGVAQAITTAN